MYATFDRLTDAKQWSNQTEADLKAGRHIPTIESRRHTLANLIDRYEKSILPQKKDPRNQKRQLKWWRDQYGDRFLADIKPSVITEGRDRLREGDRSDSTVNRYLAALSHPFTIAVKEWQWLEHNPVLKVSKLKEPRGRVRFLSDDERKQLLKACSDSNNQELHLAVTLALSTGARQAEIWGLRWDQIDLGRELVKIRASCLEKANMLKRSKEHLAYPK